MRAEASDKREDLLGMLHEGIRLRGEKALIGMDPAPADGDRVRTCCVPGLDVER